MGSGDDQQLGYVPSLDGLRALAVGAVLLYHHDPGRVPGGFLGVSLFFTLSGFLITSLLLAETGRSGTVGLASFWARRIRRIIPVAWVGLVLAIAAAVTVVPDAQRSSVFGDLRAALFSVLNWRYVFADGTYADQVQVPSPVFHYWSLAVEEQFYLVLPLLVLLIGGRRRLLGIVAAAIIALSLVQQLRIDDLNRIYYGTDVRAGELAAGVLLAVLLPWARPLVARARWRSDALGVVGLVSFAGFAMFVGFTDPWLLQGGLFIVTLASTLLLAACLGTGLVVSSLSHPALVAVGRASYSLYVVHIPIYLVLTEQRTGLPSSWLFVVRLVVSGVVAGLIHVLIEDPIRFRRALVSPVALGSAMALTSVVVLAVPLVAPVDETSGVFEVVAPSPAVFSQAGATPTTTPTPPSTEAAPGAGSPTSAPADPGDPACVGDACDPDAPAPADGTPRAPVGDASDPMRLLVIGDSTARVNGQAMAAVGAERGDTAVTVASTPACAVLPGDSLLVRSGFRLETTCTDRFASLVRDQVQEHDPDAVVVFIGASQVGLWDYGAGVDQGLDTPSVLLDYRETLDTAVEELDTLGIPVYWADVPLPRWDLDAFGQRAGAPAKGEGPVTINDRGRWSILTSEDAAALAGRTNVVQWNYVASLEKTPGVIDTSLFFDGLHLEDDIAVDLARSTWFPQLLALYGAPSVDASAPAG